MYVKYLKLQKRAEKKHTKILLGQVDKRKIWLRLKSTSLSSGGALKYMN